MKPRRSPNAEDKESQKAKAPARKWLPDATSTTRWGFSSDPQTAARQRRLKCPTLDESLLKHASPSTRQVSAAVQAQATAVIDEDVSKCDYEYSTYPPDLTVFQAYLWETVGKPGYGQVLGLLYWQGRI